MTAWLARPGGDPGRIHAEGLEARLAVETAREEVAGLLGARPRSVVFTSSATEAIASACWGGAERGSHQVLAGVEHSAVRLGAEALGEVTVVGVDHTGRIDPDELVAAIRPDTAIVHVQAANHEVGTVQPVTETVAACRERGVLVHVDAAAAAGHLPITFDDLGADLLSVSGHKLGGPAGIGALLVRRGLRIRPLLRGGDQERARRAGLEPVTLVAGFGAAAHTLRTSLDREAAEQRELTDRLPPGPGRHGRHRTVRTPDRASPSPRVRRRRGSGAAGRAARPRPGGRGGALRVVLLVGVPRAVTRARGHGRGRPPQPPPLRRLVHQRRGHRRRPHGPPPDPGRPPRLR